MAASVRFVPLRPLAAISRRCARRPKGLPKMLGHFLSPSGPTMRRQLSAPYGQPPICRRVGFYAPYCSYPTDAAALVGTLRAAANPPPSWLSSLFASDMCGGACRHPSGSRQSAAELALLAGRLLRVSIPLRSISPARYALICFRVALLLRLFCRARYMFF